MKINTSEASKFCRSRSKEKLTCKIQRNARRRKTIFTDFNSSSGAFPHYSFGPG